MTTTRIQEGNTIDWTNDTGSDVATSKVVEIGAVGYMIGVTSTAIASLAVGAVWIQEVHRLPKANVAISEGQKVYWDNNGSPVGGVALSGAMTTTSASNTYAGRCVSPVLSGGATVDVHINFNPGD